MKSIALKPRVSEKVYALSSERNTYVFDIEAGANKHDVERAVADQYKVEVINVRIANLSGKAKRSYRKRGRSVESAKKADIKKAYVTLKAGDKLPIFDAVEETSHDHAKEAK